MAAAASIIVTTTAVVIVVTTTIAIGAARAGVPTVLVPAVIIHCHAAVRCSARETVAPMAVNNPPSAGIATAAA